MDSSALVLRFAKHFFAGTALSRISGYMRDIVMASCFGSAPEIGAFMVAYRFANLFRRLLGDGSLQAGFIPHFSSLPGKSGLYFYRDCIFSLTAFLFCFVLILEAVFWGLSYFLNPDWSEILFLSMRMLPGLLFICLYALNSAFLQTQKKYFIPGVAPVFFNICWILVALFSASFPRSDAAKFLSFGVTFAFALQWFVTAMQTRHYGLPWKEWFSPQLFSGDLKKILKPISLGVIGVGATQLNSAFDAIFARLSDLSGPAYLWYAIRIEQLPLALFGIALSGALLPPLSRAMAEGALDRYAQLLYQALVSCSILIVPCAFGLFALGGPGLNLLFGHGDFTSSDILHTMHCLWAYGLGLIPSVMILLLATGFYAKKSYAVPTLASILSVTLHIILNCILVFGCKLGAFSIALSTSLATFLNCALLIYFCEVKFSRFWTHLSQLTLCGLFATMTTLYFGYTLLGDTTFTTGDFPRSLTTQIVQLFGMGIWYLAVFAGSYYALSFFNKRTKSTIS